MLIRRVSHAREVFGEGFVKGLEELEGFGHAGHGGGGGSDDGFELLEGGDVALDQSLTVPFDLFLELPVLQTEVFLLLLVLLLRVFLGSSVSHFKKYSNNSYSNPPLSLIGNNLKSQMK